MDKPVIAQSVSKLAGVSAVISAAGQTFEIHEWNGSGPGYLHVHYADDEAWHVLEGSLTFRFADGELEAPAGTTVFVPAGVAHDYFETDGPARYLIIMTPRLGKLIEALHQTPFAGHAEVMHQFESAIVEQE